MLFSNYFFKIMSIGDYGIWCLNLFVILNLDFLWIRVRFYVIIKYKFIVVNLLIYLFGVFKDVRLIFCWEINEYMNVKDEGYFLFKFIFDLI